MPAVREDEWLSVSLIFTETVTQGWSDLKKHKIKCHQLTWLQDLS